MCNDNGLVVFLGSNITFIALILQIKTNEHVQELFLGFLCCGTMA